MDSKQQKSDAFLRFRLDTLFIAITLVCIVFTPQADSGFAALAASVLIGAWLGSRTAGRPAGHLTGLVTALYFQFSVAWFFSISGLALLESTVFRVFAVMSALFGGFVGGLIVISLEDNNQVWR